MNARNLLCGLIGATLTIGGAGPSNAATDIQGVQAMRICFTPGEDCEALIVAEIARARTSIELQAYSFTAPEIAKAIVAAKARGVHVMAIVDKSQRTERYTGATFLANAGIPVLVDEKPAIAHNKVIVIDGAVTIGGSFNYTRSAQERNAENVTITYDPRVAAAFSANIGRRAAVSVPYGARSK